MKQYQRKELIEQIRGLFIDFDSYDIEMLIGSDRLGKFDGFQSKESEFIGIEKLVNIVKNLNLNMLPLPLLHELKDNLQEVNITYNNIRSFSYKAKDPVTLKAILNQEIEKVYSDLNDLTVKCSLFRYNEIDSLESKIDSSLSILSIAKKEAKDSLERIIQMQSSVEKATKETGVSTHSTEFKNLANSFKYKSWVWLIFLMLFVVSTLLFMYYSPIIVNDYSSKLIQLPDTATADQLFYYQFLPAIFLKISIFAILLYIINICKNNFYVSRHNKIINDHKAASLATFKTFTTSTQDEKTKDAILLEATKTIFDHQRTGFLKNEPESNDNTFIEVIKNIKK